LWDRPLEFDPDRFTPENAKTGDRWQCIPFSAGPRTRIGDHFAMLEATVALATIIRRTEIRSLNDDFPS
jgi:cytochrome P450